MPIAAPRNKRVKQQTRQDRHETFTRRAVSQSIYLVFLFIFLRTENTRDRTLCASWQAGNMSNRSWAQDNCIKEKAAFGLLQEQTGGAGLSVVFANKVFTFTLC